MGSPDYPRLTDYRPQVKNVSYWKLITEAISSVEDLVLRHQIDCDFTRTDAELFALDEKQEKILADLVDGAHKVGHTMTYIPSISYPIPFRKAVRIPDQARFHPIKYILHSARCWPNK